MKVKIGIIGLGYVGLPLAVEFSNKYKTIGYDINKKRINELNNGVDSTLEVSTENLNKALSNNLFLSSKIDDLTHCNFYIITVPTPTNKNNSPDLRPLLNATKTVGNILKKGDIVVYESTVYPGCTEEDCLPILEDISKLKLNEDFFIGYSPERINPGDKDRSLSNIRF